MKTDFIFDRSTIAVSLTFTLSIIISINVAKKEKSLVDDLSCMV